MGGLRPIQDDQDQGGETGHWRIRVPGGSSVFKQFVLSWTQSQDLLTKGLIFRKGKISQSRVQEQISRQVTNAC